MTKISTTQKTLENTPKKYCRFILTEDRPDWHRLVETKDGQLEYRMGVGKYKDITPRSFRTLVRTIVQTAKSHRLEYLALPFGTLRAPKIKTMGEAWLMQTLAENLALAQYEFTEYKTKKTKKHLKEILVCGVATKTQKVAFDVGLAIGEATNEARTIANTPGDDMTPSKLAAATARILKGTGATITVFNEKQIKTKKMGLLHAVGKGADDKPRFIIIEYWGAGEGSKSKKAEKPIVLVGKGITYDTGGLNIKPAGAMHDMHMDMSGGASVIATIKAIAALGIKKNVVGLIPAAENAVSATSMRAGDIVTSLSGKTVEILHTDAEGRMVLADALTYAQQEYEPALIVDIATLTGAALVALGQHASALMTKNEKLQRTLVELGEKTGDLVWPLPLWDEYKQYLKGTRADINNVAAPTGRFGGSIEGGTFLSFFVSKKIPWVHLDIAPRMDSIPSDKLAKGATGEPVRLLVELIRTHTN
ncbi:MAG: leucyl aminopeptidase family protein [Patescibacteria group bacterium]